MNGISALLSVRREVAALCSPSCEDARSQQSATWKKALSPACWHPALRLPASRIAGNKFLLLISHLVYGNFL